MYYFLKNTTIPCKENLQYPVNTTYNNFFLKITWTFLCVALFPKFFGFVKLGLPVITLNYCFLHTNLFFSFNQKI